MDKVKKFDIAICSKNIIGIVLQDTPNLDGQYTGVQLKDINKPWISKCPKVIGTIEHPLEFFACLNPDINWNEDDNN